jgi:hypothetical protein
MIFSLSDNLGLIQKAMQSIEIILNANKLRNHIFIP